MQTMAASSLHEKYHIEVDEKEIGQREPVHHEFSALAEEELAEEELAAFDRKMLLKLDLVLVPIMAMLYLLAFLDRANIGNARVVSKSRPRLTGVMSQVIDCDDC